VITISGPSNLGQASSTVLISDSVANKTQTTTTNITVDSTTGSAQIEVTQSVGAYAPTSWPPEASAGGGGGGTYFGAGTGGGTGTATGTDGTDGTVGTDGTDGTDGTNGTGSTGSIIGGTGVGVG
jgi:hypothetical protein